MRKSFYLVFLVLAACGQQEFKSSPKGLTQNSDEQASADADVSQYASTLAASNGENGQIRAANEASDALNNDSTLSESQKAAKRAEIDAKFQEVYDGLSTQQQETVKVSLRRILIKAKSMDENKRKKFLRSLRPPLPSKAVLDALIPGNANSQS